MQTIEALIDTRRIGQAQAESGYHHSEKNPADFYFDWFGSVFSENVLPSEDFMTTKKIFFFSGKHFSPKFVKASLRFVCQSCTV